MKTKKKAKATPVQVRLTGGDEECRGIIFALKVLELDVKNITIAKPEPGTGDKDNHYYLEIHPKQ